MKRIPLTQEKFALVDNEDFEWLSQWKWYASKLGVIDYYKRWHCFVFEGIDGCVFDVKCLSDIIDFMNQLKQT